MKPAAPGIDGGSLGLVVVSVPEYLGEDQRKALAFPNLNYQWAIGWFAGTGNGIGHNFSKDPALQYGLRLTADLGRKRSDNWASPWLIANTCKATLA